LHRLHLGRSLQHHGAPADQAGWSRTSWLSMARGGMRPGSSEGGALHHGSVPPEVEAFHASVTYGTRRAAQGNGAVHLPHLGHVGLLRGALHLQHLQRVKNGYNPALSTPWGAHASCGSRGHNADFIARVLPHKGSHAFATLTCAGCRRLPDRKLLQKRTNMSHCSLQSLQLTVTALCSVCGWQSLLFAASAADSHCSLQCLRLTVTALCSVCGWQALLFTVSAAGGGIDNILLNAVTIWVEGRGHQDKVRACWKLPARAPSPKESRENGATQPCAEARVVCKVQVSNAAAGYAWTATKCAGQLHLPATVVQSSAAWVWAAKHRCAHRRHQRKERSHCLPQRIASRRTCQP